MGTGQMQWIRAHRLGCPQLTVEILRRPQLRRYLLAEATHEKVFSPAKNNL